MYTQVWRKKGTEYNPVNTIPSQIWEWDVMIWAVFLYNRVEMEVIEGTINAAKYKQILSTHLLKSATGLGLYRDFVFQKENDTKHMAKRTQHWFNKNETYVHEWPSKSPDLDAIENLWKKLKLRVHTINKKKTSRN